MGITLVRTTMELITVDHDTLDTAVANNPLLLVDMWASWCVPCRRFAPIFEKMSESVTDIQFATFQVDASEENQAIFDGTGFQTIPTVLAFKNGSLAVSKSGALVKADLSEVIESLRSTDPSDENQED